MLRALLLAVILISLPLTAVADEANAKLVAAKLAYDQLTPEQSTAARLVILTKVEQNLSSIVRDDPGSDLAVKIVSGEKVAGLGLDAIRIEVSKLRSFVDTEDSLFLLTLASSRRSLCWNYDRVICVSYTKSWDNDGAITTTDYAAGTIRRRFTITNKLFSYAFALQFDQAGILAYLFRDQPLTGRQTETVRAISPDATVTGNGVRITNISLQPLKGGAPGDVVAINGTTLPYHTRSWTLSIPDNDPNGYFPGKNGAKLRSMTGSDYVIPALSLGGFSADDFAGIKAGKLIAQKVDSFDALFVLASFIGDLHSPGASDTAIKCILARLNGLPPPPPDLLAAVQAVARATDPVAAATSWINSLPLPDTDQGKKLEAIIDARFKPIADACKLLWKS